MRLNWDHWLAWALLSAVFAALTAIFGKVGVERLDPNFATLIRTVVILGVTSLIVTATGAWRPLSGITLNSYLFLLLSGLATGASWLCYYRALKLGPASQVAPIDKLSVVFVAILGVVALGEHLSLKQWLGVGLVSGGALVLALQ
jgi:transporter family protein